MTRLLPLCAFLSLLALLGVGRVAAQASNQPQNPPATAPEGPAEPSAGADGEIIPLDEGQRAPWAGLLIEESDLVRWKLTIDQLRFRLDRDVQLEIEKSAIRVAAVQEKLVLAHESQLLREELYKSRMADQDKTITAARQDAKDAAKRGFFEQPLLWFAAGVAIPIIAALAL